MVKAGYHPNPDELLKRITAQEEREKQKELRGKLKIFLGYAPGVGKTYAMLEATRQMKDVDLVGAYVETHGRKETEALIEGLEMVPRKQTQYRDMILTEMDLDAVLQRKPQLALVDEFAHTNAQGSRHPKRYQDVEELLEAGIDVYTTLNVQHIESLRNTIEIITGIVPHETIPDTVVDKATEIELVDLPVVDLLNRLKAGKVYIPKNIERASANFFREGNLLMLRELAMRIGADHIDSQSLAYREPQKLFAPRSAAERLLVCIGTGELGNRLVYAASNLAHQLNAEWHAVFVETPDDENAYLDQQSYVDSRLHLAEHLGAKVSIIHGKSMESAVLDYAQSHNITKIVVGESRRSFLRTIFSISHVDQLIRQNKYFDIHVVGASRDAPVIRRGKVDVYYPTKWKKPESKKVVKTSFSSVSIGYVTGALLVVLATLIGLSVREFVATSSIMMFYLLTVLISALYRGIGPSIIVSILSILALDFFLIQPYYVFKMGDPEHLFTFASFLAVGAVVSYLSYRVRLQTNAWHRKITETTDLYSFSKKLTRMVELDSTIRTITDNADELIDASVIILIPDNQDKGNFKQYTEDTGSAIGEHELAIATWAFRKRKTAGRGTDTLTDAELRYLPLIASKSTVGVLGIRFKNSNPMTIQQEQMLEEFRDLAALAIERTQTN